MRTDQFYRNLMRLLHDTFPGYEFLVTATSTKRDLTRFANSEVHQNISQEALRMEGVFIKDNKMAVVSSGDVSMEGLKKLKEQVDEILENTEKLNFKFKMPPLRMEYPYYMDEEEMLNVHPSKRRELFELIKSIANENNLKAFGYVANTESEVSVMSTSGLYLYHSTTYADFNTVLLNENMTGSYTSATAKNFEQLQIEEKVREIVPLAKKNIPDEEIEPGQYTVILGPEAVADIFSYFVYGALNGFAYETKTSSAVKYLGKKIGPEFLTFKDDPEDERQIKYPFDSVGTKRTTFPVIEKGEFKNILYSYQTALLFGKEPTGHTVSMLQPYMAFVMNPVIDGGNMAKEELFSKVDKGIYIHRIHYMNIVDPAELTLTGMTRDGLFIVENGEITKAVKNMRFNVNFYNLLENLKAMSKETYNIAGSFTAFIAPYALVEGFNFTSKSDH